MITEAIGPEALADFEEVLGSRRVSVEPHILDSYAAQPFHKVETGVWIHRPTAVVLPETTEEVRAIVDICNRHELRFKALSTGWGAHAGPGFDNVVQVDLRRMNRILELDVANRTIVVEPYVTCAQIQAEVFRHGLNLHIHGAGSNCSPLANATSHMGMGFSSISMGYSARNLQGVEWVLPTGDILKMGSLGSGAGWITADGPGPSLRGILRGFAGSDGGMGIFTACALKLYPWSGPAEIRPRGMDGDNLEVDVPEGNATFLCVFPDMERYAAALYDLGESEIGYLHLKVAPGLSLAISQPELFRAVRDDPAEREMLRSFEHQFIVVLQGNSAAHFDYQRRVLESLVAAHDGMLQDASSLLAGGQGGMWWALIRNSLAPAMFRPTGNFYSSMGGDEAIASAMRQAVEGEALKEGFIEQGACADDLVDNAHTLLSENGGYAHTEELVLYDHRDPEQAAKLKGLSDRVMKTIADKMLGGGGFSFFAGSYAHDYLGPHMENYHHWQRRVKTAFDPEDRSDSKYFINSERAGDPGDG